tara:strand:- start:516 stop:1433 length:918 start_codon:yes stop_codon:yes gene_type:complete
MKLLKNIIKKILIIAIGYDYFEKKIFLVGTKIALLQRKIFKIKDLSDVEFSVFSQWGDDGIINWLLENLPIKNKIFIEIGTEDYKESNTRFLLKYRNWEGYLIESNKVHIDKIKKQSIFWKHDLNLCNKTIDRENINDVIKNFKVPKEVGLLSLDIDGIDYWVWEKLKKIEPVIFICEFNSILGEKQKISVPYKRNFDRTKFHYSNLAFGASLPAFKYISELKGYKFLGTNSNGVNAYFIKKSYFKYLKLKIKKIVSYQSKTRESRDKSYRKNYLSGVNRINQIKNKNFEDVRNNKKFKIRDIKI